MFWLFASIVEQAEGVLVAIVQQSIEFALCYLENSGVTSDDLGIQVCLRTLQVLKFCSMEI